MLRVCSALIFVALLLIGCSRTASDSPREVTRQVTREVTREVTRVAAAIDSPPPSPARDSTSRAGPPSPCKANTAANLRSCPSTTCDVVGAVAANAAVFPVCVNTDRDWYQLDWEKWIYLPLVDCPSASISPCRTLDGGTASPTPPVTKTPPPPPPCFVWTEAQGHLGKTCICGPVVSTYYASGSNGQPTFLNVGADANNPKRIAVVIWGRNRPNFPQPPESQYRNQRICVAGKLTPYKDALEIEVVEPANISVWR